MKRFAFYGLRRSGNHAILEWLIQNLGDLGERNVIKDRRLIAVNSAAYINEANTYQSPEELQEHHSLADKMHESLIVAYEDVGFNYILPVSKGYKNIVIIRDIPNLFASRYKKGQEYAQSMEVLIPNMLIDEKTVQLWKEHAIAGMNGDAILIQFEKWLDSKEYRDQISAKFNATNHDITDTITEFGDGSSFSGKRKPTAEELKSRYKQVVLPSVVSDRIQQPDIIELRKKLGYIN